MQDAMTSCVLPHLRVVTSHKDQLGALLNSRGARA